jgi:CRISPR type III-A-associated protein Csm2
MSDKNHGFFQGTGGRDGKKPQMEDTPKKGPEHILFRDEKKNLRRELLVKEAEKWANQMDEQKVSYTQLRKFYSEALALKSKMGKEKKQFEEIEALIGMMISKAHYAMVRDKKNQELYRFINSCITSVHSEQDYNDFVIFFEAVLGFYPRKN